MNLKQEDKTTRSDMRIKRQKTRTKFSESRTRATRPLQIIHTDMCGPVDPNIWDKKR